MGPVEQQRQGLSDANIVEWFAPHVEGDVCDVGGRVVEHGSLCQEASLEALTIELFHPHLRVACNVVVIQFSLLQHLDRKILVAYDDSLEFIEIILSDVPAIFLRPVVLSAAQRD